MCFLLLLVNTETKVTDIVVYLADLKEVRDEADITEADVLMICGRYGSDML